MKSRCIPRIGAHLMCAAALLSVASGDLPAAEKPNVIIILADDLGYGDVSCYGATRVETPQIDRLAREGRRFTSGYCSAATCTPTRYSLLTGNYAFRTPNTGVAPPAAPAIIPPGTETFASILRRAGYATAVVGKWHLGLGAGAPDWNGEIKPGPLEIGFDHCFLLPTTNDRVPQVYVEDHRVRGLDPADPLWVGSEAPSPDHPTGITHRDQLRMNWSRGHNQTVHNGIGRIGFYTGGEQARFRDEELADAWVEHSVAWIERHRDRPFCLYFASHDIHVPRMPHERFQGKSAMGYRGDAILELDWQVGALLDALDRLKLSEKTLVVLCSDNGPVLDDGYQDGAVEKLGDHRPAGPFRGGKYSVFEGGTRTPFITRWPGRIPAGVSDALVTTTDLTASLAALVGEPLNRDACIDSFNQIETWLGDRDTGRDYVLQQNNNGSAFGLRQGSWKLVRQKLPPRQARETGQAVTEQLFDLASDPGETTDVSGANDDTYHRLRELLDEIVQGSRTRGL